MAEGDWTMTDLASLKDKHAGERCFILGAGPSLNKTPWLPDALADEITIGCNRSIIPGPPDGWPGIVPTYLCVCDPRNYEVEKADFDALGATKLFFFNALACTHADYAGCFPLPEGAIRVPRLSGRGKRISDLAPNTFDLCPALDGLSVAMDCAQLAFYMGCNPVYLVGCDCTSDGHFYDPHEPVGRPGRYDVAFEDKAQWACVRYVFALNGRAIYNAGVGGTLASMPRVDVRQLLNIEVL